MLELNNLYNMDCMDGMRQFPDGYFDLAIVDPPYGINVTGTPGGGNKKIVPQVDDVIFVPRTETIFSAAVAIVPLQLLAYYTSVNRGLDVDKPRNLAKSVTVE